MAPLGLWIEECDIVLDSQLRARSSLFGRYNCMLANGVGTLDSDYRDEVGALLYNPGPHSVFIPSGTAIVQFIYVNKEGVVEHHPQFKVEPVARAGGMGSTDRDGVEL